MFVEGTKLTEEGIEESKEPNVQLCLPDSQADKSSSEVLSRESKLSPVDSQMGIKTRRMSKLQNK